MKYFLLLCLSFFLFNNDLSSQGYTIEDYQTDITVRDDGQLDITETIMVNFTERRRGIYRNIPFKYSFEGIDIDIALSNISVANYEYNVSKKGRDRIIRIGNKDKYITGLHTYKISYTASYPIINHGNYQELYWNVMGHKWDTSIKRAEVIINLPKDLALSTDDMKVWTGKQGSTSGTAKLTEVTTKSLMASTKTPLSAGEGMTIAMKMPSDFLNIPDKETIRAKTNAANGVKPPNPYNKSWWLGLPLALLAGLDSWWKSVRAREITPIYNSKYEHYPPQGFTSAHIGGFIDHTVHPRDVLSLLPYWAAEGYISMHHDKELVLKREKRLPDDFPEYERKFFNQVFENGHNRVVDDIKGKLGGAITDAKTEIDKEISYQDYYDEDYLNVWKSWKVAVLIILPIIGAVISFVMGMHWLGAGCIVLLLGILIMASHAPSMSPKGKNLMARLQAFERFLKDAPAADTERLLRDDPTYFDKMLPFAVAFGIDKSWLKSLEPHLKNSPDWYHHSAGMGYGHFTRDYDNKSIAQSFSVPPAPVSSGGGFSGGGSSGGGFGGGGGGSW